MLKLVGKQYVSAAMVYIALLTGEAVAAEWTPGPPMNGSRGFAASAVDPCGNIMVVGGMRRTDPTQTILADIEVLAFDGLDYSENWTTSNITLPIERFFHSAVVANGFLYVIGGARWGSDPNNAEPILAVDRYDFLAGTWSSNSVPPLPYSLIAHASVVDTLGRIWVIGGQTPNDHFGVQAGCIVYDPARPSLGWQTMPSLNTARVNAGAVVDHMGRIWAIGGLANGYVSHLDTVEVLDVCGGGGWTTITARLPAPASNSVQAVLGKDGHIYAIGGWIGGYSNRVLRTNPRDGSATWTTWSSLGVARNEHSAVLGNDGVIYVTGGEAFNVQSQTSVETLNSKLSLGDMNEDGFVTVGDIGLFVECLVNGGCP